MEKTMSVGNSEAIISSDNSTTEEICDRNKLLKECKIISIALSWVGLFVFIIAFFTIFGWMPKTGCLFIKLYPSKKAAGEPHCISYEINNQTSVNEWARNLDEVLLSKISYIDTEISDKVESLNLTGLDKCSKTQGAHYGYDIGSPCIFIRVTSVKDCQKSKFFRKNTVKTNLNDPDSYFVCYEREDHNASTNPNVESFIYNAANLSDTKFGDTLDLLISVKIVSPKRDVVIELGCDISLEFSDGIYKSNEEYSVLFNLLIGDTIKIKEESDETKNGTLLTP